MENLQDSHRLELKLDLREAEHCYNSSAQGLQSTGRGPRGGPKINPPKREPDINPNVPHRLGCAAINRGGGSTAAAEQAEEKEKSYRPASKTQDPPP